MASKKTLELKEFGDSELKEELARTETEYIKMKFDHTVSGLENPLDLREVRRDIARLKTEMRSRELENSTKKRDKIQARRRLAKKIKK